MSMSKDKTLIGMAKKEEVSKFMIALRKAKEDANGAKAYARLNPVCARCQKSEHACLLMPDGIRCTRCRILKQACPRLIDFWIAHISRRLGRPEAYVKDLYSQHGTSKRCHAGGAVRSRSEEPAVFVIEEEEEGSETEEEADNSDSDGDEATRDNRAKIHEYFHVLHPQSKTKASGQTSTSGTNRREAGITSTHSHSKSELESQRKEIELLKRRAETAEGNFVALVGRIQDFRTSLRSEIHAMPPDVESEGFSTLSAAMDTTIDDAGLYLRNISGALKQSRSNWEIQYGTQPQAGGSKEPRAIMRQVRQRSPEVQPDGNMQKRRKI